ncbi:ABC transporter ATP-binding protein [Mongoliimonas terrestris]|uniref:ABC transporter ATP-binding protein n=1 Tax=Mongoliimonas terrestris TaxID=1709001 RepID=UPI0009498F38|nr:ATP-binding cassette domain-containing protein [Mongoliimonas terrestris]
MSAPLELHIKKKTYQGAEGGEVEAVRDLHLLAPAGSLTALIGPSGCGKTTSLRILARLDTRFEGTIGLPPAARIGFVFQEPRLLPWRTVEQNVRLVMEGGGADLDALFAELGLEDMRNRFPTELSLGLARRVSIARALAIEPDVLLLDEPFTSLDETTAQRLRQLVLTVWRRYQPTTLMVTHNVREAIQLAERIVLLAPRPSHVVAEIVLDTPHEQRDEVFVEATRTDLVGRYPGLIA